MTPRGCGYRPADLAAHPAENDPAPLAPGGQNGRVGVKPVFGQDPSAAAWVGARLTGFGRRVTDTVPAGFAAYARILHPIQVTEDRWLTWSDVAVAAGTRVHPLVQWRRLAHPGGSRMPGWGGGAPEKGNLPVPALRSLLAVLSRHTASPDDCWLCLWDGYGWIRGTPSVAIASVSSDGRVTERLVPAALSTAALEPSRTVRFPGRNYLLARGALDAALTVGWWLDGELRDPQSPNLFWPDDHSWCVATEIDFDSTLVAGSEALIEDLLRERSLEAWRIDPDDSLQTDADQVN
jgi:hypothetical protein